MPERKALEKEILAVLDQFREAYQSGSVELFDFLTEDVSVFSLSVPERFDGLEEYRRDFEPALVSGQRVSHFFDVDVRSLGETAALVTYHNRIRSEGFSMDNRTTLLFVKEDETFKVAHMHVSPMAAPSQVTATPEGMIEDIIELEEGPA